MKLTPIIALVAIFLMAIYALYQGVDGVIFITASTAIAGLGGYELRVWRASKEDKTKYVEELLKRAGYTEKFIGTLVKRIKGGE